MDLQQFRQAARSLAQRAAEALGNVQTSRQLEEARIEFLGKKGHLAELMRQLGRIPAELRPEAGRVANEAKQAIQNHFTEREKVIARRELEARIETERLDITLPGTAIEPGHAHPVSQILDEMTRVFRSMGFQVADGPEIEDDFHNFTALNIPPDHPARDMHDTFYVKGGRLLRTHTSPVQIRTMKRFKPPVAFIAPGRVYRCDSDVTHSPMFHQVEGFMVDRSITFGHLKGVLGEFAHKMFGENVGVRFRPSYFPFTEPSAEMDIECLFCAGEGCRVCKDTGWLEILGAGMIHPVVLENVGYNPEHWQGFAFGMGVERIAMLRFGINDIRLFFENDLRFLRQF
ncbi:MAG: phenylalanine--tRNA ligase subunit alpha [Candidatus Sumerlaeia bacterium]